MTSWAAAVASWGKPGFSVPSFLGPRLNIVSPHVADSHYLSSWQLLCSLHALLSPGLYFGRTTHGQYACVGFCSCLQAVVAGASAPVLSAQAGESLWSLDCGRSELTLLPGVVAESPSG